MPPGSVRARDCQSRAVGLAGRRLRRRPGGQGLRPRSATCSTREIDFRGLTPRRDWEASDPDAVIGSVLRQWFEDADEIEELVKVETDSFADRERVGYRFRVRNPEGLFEVEQQVYIGERRRPDRLDAQRLLRVPPDREE